MENEFQEYVTFFITAKDGSEVELAVVDEFDFEDKHYVVGAVLHVEVFELRLYAALADHTGIDVKRGARLHPLDEVVGRVLRRRRGER